MENLTKCYCGHTTTCDCGQETLEEVAERKFQNIGDRLIFEEGAKWQQERSNEMFTKDDLIAFYEFIKKECDIVNTSGYAETHTNWFIKKFKNYEIKR